MSSRSPSGVGEEWLQRAMEEALGELPRRRRRRRSRAASLFRHGCIGWAACAGYVGMARHSCAVRPKRMCCAKNCTGLVRLVAFADASGMGASIVASDLGELGRQGANTRYTS